MKLAIIGSRGIKNINFSKYISENVTEIVSGGAKGVDTLAREFALSKKIKLTEFIPDYKRYGKAAPLMRNLSIIEYSDSVIAFWDGQSKGTKFVIDNCKKSNKPIVIITTDIK